MKRRTSLQWFRVGVFIGVLAVVAVMAGISLAWAEERDDGNVGGGDGFSNHSLKGYYGFNSSYGALVASGPNQPVVPALPFASMGRIITRRLLVQPDGLRPAALSRRTMRRGLALRCDPPQPSPSGRASARPRGAAVHPVTDGLPGRDRPASKA